MQERTLRRIFLVLEAVGASLEDADFVVESLDEAERDFVLGFAVSGDAVPVTIDHLGEALAGFETLPFEAGAPVVEEAARPAFAVIVPKLAEGLLQDVGGVQPLVRVQKKRERALALESEILVARQQRVLLAPRLREGGLLMKRRSLPPRRAYSALRT
jgi:hypothetical protein